MNIWLDDQRKAPEGWTHLHNIDEVQELMELARVSKDFSIDSMSFDFHLDHPKRGIDVMEYLAELCRKEKTDRFWPKNVLYHTSDPKAEKIMKAFAESFEKEILPRYKE